MTCEETQRELTAYLDGELGIECGRAVRGHLRSCAHCRAAAHDESVLRDGLRSLPPVEAPAQLWRDICRQLADAEVADARRPRWWRAAVGSTRSARGIGLVLAGAAIAMSVVVWRANHRQLDQAPVALLSTVSASDSSPCSSDAPRDVALALASETTCVTEAYAAAAADLVRIAMEQRTQWDHERTQRFDVALDDLRHDVDVAPDGRPRQRAYRAMIRFLQRVTTREEMFADVRGAR